MAVVRYLINALRFGVEIPPEDLEKLKAVLEEHKLSPTEGWHVVAWFQKNGPKMFHEARDVNAALKLSRELKLDVYLRPVYGNENRKPNLRWWLMQDSWEEKSVGAGGKGETAASLGIHLVVARGIRFRAWPFATPDGRPNEPSEPVQVWRGIVNGMYVRGIAPGRRVDPDDVRYYVDPRAREGVDFEIVSEFSSTGVDQAPHLAILNPNALTVIPERPTVDFSEASSEYFRQGGQFEQMRRKAAYHPEYLDSTRIQRLVTAMREEAPVMGASYQSAEFVREWLRLPESALYPEVVEDALEGGRELGEWARAILFTALDLPHWQTDEGKRLRKRIKPLPTVEALGCPGELRRLSPGRS
jgi:hypothetical protein